MSHNATGGVGLGDFQNAMGIISSEHLVFQDEFLVFWWPVVTGCRCVFSPHGSQTALCVRLLLGVGGTGVSLSYSCWMWEIQARWRSVASQRDAVKLSVASVRTAAEVPR